MAEADQNVPLLLHCSSFHRTTSCDRVVACLVTAGALAMVGGNIILFRNRNYRPIKAKNVPLTVLSSLGGLTWIFSSIATNHHFRNPQDFFPSCVLWSYWLQVCFGFTLWLSCLIMRLLILHRILVLKRDGPRRPYLVLLLIMSPVIGFCIAATRKSSIIFEPVADRNHGDCKFNEKESLWAYAIISLLLLYFVVFLSLAFHLRNIISQYNEFRSTRRGGILSLFLFLYALVTFNSGNYEMVLERCSLTISVTFVVFYYFWARNAEVLYNCLFHRSAYEHKFIADLARMPSDNERGKVPVLFLRLRKQLKLLMEEIQQQHDHIAQLETEVHMLESQYNSMQQMNTFLHSSEIQTL